MIDLWPGRCGKRASVFQAKPAGVGRLWTRRAPRRGVDCGPEGRAESPFRGAKSVRQSSSLSMPAHRPGLVGRDLAPKASGSRFQRRERCGDPLRMLIRERGCPRAEGQRPDSERYPPHRRGAAAPGSLAPVGWSNKSSGRVPSGNPCRTGRPPQPRLARPWSSGTCAGYRTEGRSRGPSQNEHGGHSLNARRLGPRTRWPGSEEQTYADYREPCSSLVLDRNAPRSACGAFTTVRASRRP